jgi:hypothetical protein
MHLGHQEDLITTPVDCLADEFLGCAPAIHLGGIDQRHAEVETKAQRRDLVRPALRVIAQVPRGETGPP